MPGRLLLGEVRRQAEGVDAATEEGLERVLVFAVREAAQDRTGSRALQRRLRLGGAFAQGADDREAFFIAGLVGLLRRHLPQGQLIDDVAGLDDLRQGLQRQLELMERSVALVDVGVVALEAVAAEELFDRLRRRIGGGGAAGREDGAQGKHAAERSHGSGFRKRLTKSDGEGAQEKRPVLLPKASVSTPIFWAMST
jgi:hypothetical protein